MLLKASVNCWFCNENSRVPYTNRNSWWCPHCQQYNGFKADGDYNIDVCAAAASDNVRYNVAVPSPGTGSNSVTLCQECRHNQSLLVRQLAEFEPQYAGQYETELRQYRRRLEKLYRLCAPCATLVHQTVESQDRQMAPAVAAWRLQHQHKNHVLRVSRLGSTAGYINGMMLCRSVHYLCLITLLLSYVTHPDCWLHRIIAPSFSSALVPDLAVNLWHSLSKWLYVPLVPPYHWLNIRSVMIACCCAIRLFSSAFSSRISIRSSLMFCCLWAHVCVLEASLNYGFMSRPVVIFLQMLLVMADIALSSLLVSSRRTTKRNLTESNQHKVRAMRASVAAANTSSPQFSNFSRTVNTRSRRASVDECTGLTALSLDSCNARNKSSPPSAGVFSLRQYSTVSSGGGRDSDTSSTAETCVTSNSMLRPTSILAPARFVYGQTNEASGTAVQHSSWIAGDFWERQSSPLSPSINIPTSSRASSSQSSGFIDTPRVSRFQRAITTDDNASTITAGERSPSIAGTCCSRHSPAMEDCHRWSPGSVTSTCTMDARLMSAGVADWRPVLAALVLGFSLAFNVFVVLYLVIREGKT